MTKTAEPDVEIVEVPDRRVIAVDGAGDPEGPAFSSAVQSLYSVAYGAKFALKKQGVVTGKVNALEALWSGLSHYEKLAESDRKSWRWTALIAIPDEVTSDIVHAVASVKPTPSPVEIRVLHEGECVQAMHIGPYADEPRTLRRMHTYMAEHALKHGGAHHEIYFGDPRRTAPEKLRTLLRQPVIPA